MSSSPAAEEENYALDSEITENGFCQARAKEHLRICCYGSSSSNTPSKFKREAFKLGYILAKRGHTCVNGAGSFGCMVREEDLVCVMRFLVDIHSFIYFESHFFNYIFIFNYKYTTII